MKKEDILKKGSVEVHAKISGIRQLHVLKVIREKTVWGMVPYLVGEHRIPAAELVRLAEELQLPIKCAGLTVFPKGKAAQDFAEKDDKKKDPKPPSKGLSHNRLIEKNEEEEDGSDDEEEEEKAEATEEEQETKSEEEPGETKPKQKKAIGEKSGAPLEKAEAVAEKIELENAVPPEKAASTVAQPNGTEEKENGQEKKKIFCEEVLSEGIIQ